MEINKKQKQQILIRYLNQYLLKKDLRMKNVVRNIVYRIEFINLFRFQKSNEVKEIIPTINNYMIKIHSQYNFSIL